MLTGLSAEFVARPMFKMHEVAKYYTETGGLWGGNHLSMDLSQYNALSDAEKAALTKGMESFDEIARNGDTAWVIEGIAAIKKEIKEWHKPSEAEMSCGVPER